MIEYYSPYFGPLIMNMQIDEAIVKSIETSAYTARESNPKTKRKLGEFDDGRPEDFVALRWKLDVNEELRQYFDVYLEEGKKLQNIGEYKEDKGYRIESLWANFTQRGEYQPLHNHGGDLSYNLIIQQPKGLGEAGNLYFRYGEDMEFNINTYRVEPQRGQLIIFPSWVMHYVFPTMSTEERVTAAGNIFLL